MTAKIDSSSAAKNMSGSALHLASADDVEWFAGQMAATEPWLGYGCTIEWTRQRLDWPGSMLWIAADRAGGILMHERGFLGAPYIATLLVAEEHRNRGVGSQLLRHAEHVFSGQRQIFLCVSAANERARALYLRHGFEQVAILPDLVVEGRDELLLRKRLPSPLQG
jgi:ribosomal protein S18 acetylase RimI-like enzyme